MPEIIFTCKHHISMYDSKRILLLDIRQYVTCNVMIAKPDLLNNCGSYAKKYSVIFNWKYIANYIFK